MAASFFLLQAPSGFERWIFHTFCFKCSKFTLEYVSKYSEPLSEARLFQRAFYPVD